MLNRATTRSGAAMSNVVAFPEKPIYPAPAARVTGRSPDMSNLSDVLTWWWAVAYYCGQLGIGPDVPDHSEAVNLASLDWERWEWGQLWELFQDVENAEFREGLRP
jgi:hypothetical protein